MRNKQTHILIFLFLELLCHRLWSICRQFPSFQDGTNPTRIICCCYHLSVFWERWTHTVEIIALLFSENVQKIHECCKTSKNKLFFLKIILSVYKSRAQLWSHLLFSITDGTKLSSKFLDLFPHKSLRYLCLYSNRQQHFEEPPPPQNMSVSRSTLTCSPTPLPSGRSLIDFRVSLQ